MKKLGHAGAEPLAATKPSLFNTIVATQAATRNTRIAGQL
jgi:hypothetical protein